MRPAIAAIVGAACLLGGCASIVEGTDQEITVKLAPENTVCSVNRKGAEVGSISKTNSIFVVGKSRNPLYFKCSAPGFQENIVRIDSSASGWGVAGCFLWDLCLTDYATGALNSYPETVTIALAKADQNVYQTFNAQTATLLVAPVPVAAWRTIDDLVMAYAEPGGNGSSIEMPSHVPLSLLEE